MDLAHVSSMEQNFLNTANNGEYNFKKASFPVKNEALQLDTTLAAPKARSGYFFAAEIPKKRIVIHHTAGALRSDMSALTQNAHHVSVAYVIARDGTIYQLFSPKEWSGHIGLGVGNIQTGNAQDKSSIGIELSNYGFLVERDGNLETIYSRQKDAAGKVGPVDVYCSKNDQQAYTHLDTPFRGQNFFATFTDEQYNSLIILLRYLSNEFGIPREFVAEPLRYQTFDDVVNFNGIVSHINYRKDGKWDIGPAFDWKKVIDGVQAASFTPAALSRGTRDIEMVTTAVNDDQMHDFFPQPADPKTEDDPYEEVNRSEIELKDRKKRLFALLVGINDYESSVAVGNDQVIFPKLSGCVSDAKKMGAYLKEEKSFDQHIITLTDHDATKPAIIDAIKNHLGKAGENDVAFLYFSGHGTEEKANAAFNATETDGKLESIACYYTKETRFDFLLADKELRWLIHGLSKNQPHIVTIFDCCHSGDNTRNAALLDQSFSNVVEKRVAFVFPERPWEYFAFHDKIKPEQIIKEGVDTLLPEGNHFQVSACEANESAVEIGGEGVFTKTLLRILTNAGGDLSYYSLGSRLRQYMRNVYEQKPKIYVAGGKTEEIYKPFLNKAYSDTPNSFGEVTYSTGNIWQLNRGALHGIDKSISSFDLFDPEDPSNLIKAAIKSIGIDYTELVPEKALDHDKVFRTPTAGINSGGLKIHFDIARGALEEQQEVLDTLLKDFGKLINTEDDKKEAQYSLLLRNGRYYMTLRNDEYRPLAETVDACTEGAPSAIASQIKQIADWEFIKNLVNRDGDSKLDSAVLKVEVAIGDEEFKTINDAERLEVNYTKKDGEWVSTIRVRVTNTANQDLYCAAVYLPATFESFIGYLKPQVYLLEPGNSIDLKLEGNPLIPMETEEFMKWYNWKELTDHFKFIYSTTPFDVTSLAFDALPPPEMPGRAKKGAMRAARTTPKVDKAKGWSTKQFQLVSINPRYNKISNEDLQLFLDNEQTAFFALGLYFEDATGDATEDGTNGLKSTLKYKEGIEITEETRSGVMGLIIDIANYWARAKRNRWYDNALKKFPGRIKIVSEGDSWFQHPLVLDIIDHLHRVFNIYCVAAAGDTLRNYFSKQHTRGMYYLDAIEEHEPKIFLISGGGNDILGSQFQNYLTDKPDQSKPEGTEPKRFLKDELFKELDSLMELYYTAFEYLKTYKPNLQIIVHGYDYPVKLDDAKKGWLGKYMIKKGIDRPGDRQAIIHLIMDEFNKRLEATAVKFPNTVTYLDVRNIVRFNKQENVDQWYDEIHPNNDGFQQIAQKFIQAIVKITGSKPAGDGNGLEHELIS